MLRWYTLPGPVVLAVVVRDVANSQGGVATWFTTSESLISTSGCLFTVSPLDHNM